MACQHYEIVEYNGAGDQVGICQNCGQVKLYYYEGDSDLPNSKIIKHGKEGEMATSLTKEEREARDDQIIELHRSGKSAREIRAELGLPNESQVYDALRRRNIPARRTKEPQLETESEAGKDETKDETVEPVLKMEEPIKMPQQRGLNPPYPAAVQALLDWLPPPGMSITQDYKQLLYEYFMCALELMYPDSTSDCEVAICPGNY